MPLTPDHDETGNEAYHEDDKEMHCSFTTVALIFSRYNKYSRKNSQTCEMEKFRLSKKVSAKILEEIDLEN